MGEHKYRDNQAIGTGAVKCAACDEPLRDHKLTEKCPTLGDEKLTVARPRSQRRARTNITEAERAGE